MKVLMKVLAGLSLVLALVLSIQPKASAHAFVVDVSPDPDSVLDTSPGHVTITFNEPVSGTGSSIRVFDPSGGQISGIEARSQKLELSAELPGLTDEGSYTVSWRVLSADGHQIDGAFLFSIGKPTLIQPLDVGSGRNATLVGAARAVAAVLGWVSLASLICLVALSARSKRALNHVKLVLAGVLHSAVLSVTAALLAVDGGLSERMATTWNTASGKATFAALTAAVVSTVIIALRIRSTERLRTPDRRLVIGLALFTTVVMALVGHSLAIPPVALSAPLTVLHVLAAIVWLAGLFWIERRTRTVAVDEVRADVSRYSNLAVVTVAILAVSGMVLFATRVPIGALMGSSYGVLGSIKLVLLAMALVLAWQNRSTMVLKDAVTTSELGDAGDADEQLALARSHRDAVDLRRFKASVKIETVVVSAALVLGAVLAQTSPPGSGRNAGGFFGERKPFGDGRVELTIDPSRRGVNEIHVTATGPDGRLMADVSDLKLAFMLPEKDFGPLEPSLQKISAGHSYTFARIPFAGDWTVVVTATVGKFDQLEARFEVPMGG